MNGTSVSPFTWLPAHTKSHCNFSYMVLIPLGKLSTKTEKKTNNFVQSPKHYFNMFTVVLNNLTCCGISQQCLRGMSCPLKPSACIRPLCEKSLAKPSDAFIYLKTLFNSELALLLKL